jgi:hypothetical protein
VAAATIYTNTTASPAHVFHSKRADHLSHPPSPAPPHNTSHQTPSLLILLLLLLPLPELPGLRLRVVSATVGTLHLLVAGLSLSDILAVTTGSIDAFCPPDWIAPNLGGGVGWADASVVESDVYLAHFGFSGD